MWGAHINKYIHEGQQCWWIENIWSSDSSSRSDIPEQNHTLSIHIWALKNIAKIFSSLSYGGFIFLAKMIYNSSSKNKSVFSSTRGLILSLFDSWVFLLCKFFIFHFREDTLDNVWRCNRSALILGYGKEDTSERNYDSDEGNLNFTQNYYKKLFGRRRWKCLEKLVDNEWTNAA